MKTSAYLITLALGLLALTSCNEDSAADASKAEADSTTASAKVEEKVSAVNTIPDESNIPADAEVVTLGGGCFWCVEEVFHQVDGVHAAISGYMGGEESDADYKKVAQGRTDHAEVVQVAFDPKVISFDELLEVFWNSHDPTQLNRQGPDFGRQYRSVIFYHSEEQKAAAEASKKKLQESGKHGGKDIVTLIEPEMGFYEAEDYHQNYARLNPGNPYIHQQLHPKLKKLGMEIPTGVTNNQIKGSGSQPKP